jgi:hypothetical protein
MAGTAVDDTAVDDTAVDDTAVDDTAVDDTAVERGCSLCAGWGLAAGRLGLGGAIAIIGFLH